MHTKPKFVVLLIATLLLPFSGSAQSWQELCSRVDSLREAGDFSLAITAAQQALDIARKTFGEMHSNYAGSLKQLGEVQAEKGDYVLAELNTVTSRDLYRKLYTTMDSNYINTTVTLGVVARFRGKFLESEAYYQEALKLTEQVIGKESVNYVDILGDLGTVYLDAGKLTSAESILLTALAIKGELNGRQSMEYSVTLGSLGNLYRIQGDFTRAESYLTKSLQLREKLFPKDHISIAAPLNNLALLYEKQGNHSEALKLCNRAISIYEKKEVKSAIYLAVLNNTAAAYTTIKEYRQADSLYKKLQPMLAQSIGIDNQQYAVLLGNRGVLQRSMRQYDHARQLLEQAYSLCIEKSGEDHPFSINIMANLAETYSYIGKEQAADSLFRKMRSLGREILGVGNLDYADYSDKYSQFCLSTSRIDSSLIIAGEVLNIVKSNLSRNLLYQTTRQKERFVAKCTPLVRTAFELSMKYPLRTEAVTLAYNGSLLLKNLLLSQYTSLFAGDVQTTYTNLQALTDTLRQVSDQIATQYTLPIAQRKNLDSLEARAETLEKDLARQSAPFRQAQKALQVRWQDIRDGLKPTEAAVEFVSFPYHNGRQQTDSVRYMALVLRPGDTAPQVVPLITDEAPLRRLLARKTSPSGSSALYATRGSELDTDQLTQGDSLYRLVWQPIDHLLKGAKTVYLSPSGLLHQVAFAALPYRDPRRKGPGYLADRYQLRQVGSTRQIASPNPSDDTFKGIDSARLYGGIQYDSTSKDRSKPWPFLPGTMREVEQISQIIGPRSTVVTAASASETDMKAQSGKSPSVLHVATHGFAFPDPLLNKADSSLGGNMFRRISNPLFRTGLLMAGANTVWKGGRPALGGEDGILTAYEVANLNLTHTRLVVLSACETALGDIQGSEGVFGLQRAFKMAGVNYLLMSLWPVSDDATSALMTQFYRNWKRYKTIRLAFQKTQLQMRQKYPPSVWAAFVLVE